MMPPLSLLRTTDNRDRTDAETVHNAKEDMIISFPNGPSHGNQSASGTVKRNRHQRASGGEQLNLNGPIHSPLSETQFGGGWYPSVLPYDHEVDER